MSKTKLLEIAGFVAGAILVAFGVVAIVMGVNGRNTVHSNLAAEKIVFGDAATDPTVPAKYSNHTVDTGAEARAFAKMMREHTMSATGGFTYAQMGRYQALPSAPKAALAAGGGTNDAKYAVVDAATKQPVANGARNLWVQETALSTALNTSYMADNLALFGIVVGVALLLAGIGLTILAWFALGAFGWKKIEGQVATMKPVAGH
jgi:hypothetical protein